MIDNALTQFLLGFPGIAAVAGDRIYPAPKPQGAAVPAITYTDISNVGSYSNDGADCLSKARYQLDHWANTKEDANRLEQATRTALSGFRGRWQGLNIGGVFRRNTWTLYEPETQLWRAISDYQINALGA